MEVTQIDRGEFSKYKIVVKDTGVGMSEEFLPHLFEPYAAGGAFFRPDRRWEPVLACLLQRI